MEPMDINGGRFYVRPLHDDNRIDDRPALSLIHNHPIPEDYVENGGRNGRRKAPTAGPHASKPAWRCWH